MMWGIGLASVLMLSLAQTIPPMSGLPDLSTHKEVKTEVEINASAATVWRTLTDFAAYNVWNPYIYPASGEAVAGRQLDLTLHVGSAVHYTPTVVAAQPERELSWAGKTPVEGIEHVATFEIHPLGPHRVHLVATEWLKGLLLPLVSVAGDSSTGLRQMTRALRDRAELLDFSLPAPAMHLTPHI
jgi:hypothetical protein